MIEAAKSDMTPGTSVLVVMRSDGGDSVAQAFQGQDMELIRSDLSVQALGNGRLPVLGALKPQSRCR